LRYALTFTPPDQYTTLQHLCLSKSKEIKKSRNQEIKKSRNQEIKKSRNQEIKKSRNQEIKGVSVIDVVLTRPMREAEPCGRVATNRL